MNIDNLINEIKSLKPLKNKDSIVKIIPVNDRITIDVHAPGYSQKKRRINYFYNHCRVVSINNKLKATLVSKTDPLRNVLNNNK